MYEHVAGIDVHKEMIKVAIRSPGDKPWTRKTEIFERYSEAPYWGASRAQRNISGNFATRRMR